MDNLWRIEYFLFSGKSWILIWQSVLKVWFNLIWWFSSFLLWCLFSILKPPYNVIFLSFHLMIIIFIFKNQSILTKIICNSFFFFVFFIYLFFISFYWWESISFLLKFTQCSLKLAAHNLLMRHIFFFIEFLWKSFLFEIMILMTQVNII